MRSKEFNYRVKVGERAFIVQGLIWPPDKHFKDVPKENNVDYEILSVEQVEGPLWSKDPRICGEGTINDFMELNYLSFEKGIMYNYSQEARR
jgi:hypothetical protein